MGNNIGQFCIQEKQEVKINELTNKLFRTNYLFMKQQLEKMIHTIIPWNKDLRN